MSNTDLKIEVQDDGNLVSSNGDIVVGGTSPDPGGQIYIIQTTDGGDGIPVEGTEVVVAEDLAVYETVSALEQLSRGQVITTEGGELLQVYEEVVLPDGTSAELVTDSGANAVADLGMVNGRSASPIKIGPMTIPGENIVGNQIPMSGTLTLTSVSTPAKGPPSANEFHICRICNQIVQLNMLAEHNAQAHGHIRDLTCMDCGKLFKSKRSLFGHRKEKHSGMLEVHSCPECGKSFGRKSNLKAHRESLHYGKKFPCCYCERIFTNRSSMNQHIKKTHVERQPAQGIVVQ